MVFQTRSDSTGSAVAAMYLFIFFAGLYTPQGGTKKSTRQGVYALWVKENEAKERPFVSLDPSDFLALLEVAGSLKTRFAQTVQTP